MMVTGLLLGRLDRLSIILVKNKTILEKTFFFRNRNFKILKISEKISEKIFDRKFFQHFQACARLPPRVSSRSSSWCPTGEHGIPQVTGSDKVVTRKGMNRP